MRVIIIENDEGLRRIVSDCLRLEGIHVIAQAASVQEALPALSARDADIILTDCDMPGMSGIEFVRHLRGAGDQTPVVMLSGEEDPTAIAAALAAGVNRYLIKPVSLQLLAKALRQTCRSAAA